MKKIVYVIVGSLFAVSFVALCGGGVLHAQEAGKQFPLLTQEAPSDIRGIEDLTFDKYPPQGQSPLLNILGRESQSGVFSAFLLSLFGEYGWMLLVFYYCALLAIVFILYASVFKRFKQFSREQAIVFGWNTTKKHIWFFVLISVIQLLVYAPLLFLFLFSIPPSNSFAPYTQPALLILAIKLWFVFTLFSIGIIKISLAINKGIRPRVRDLFTGITIFPQFVFSALLTWIIILGPYFLLGGILYVLWKGNMLNPLQIGVASTVGSILLAFPASHWFLKFLLNGFVVVDTGAWPLKALRLASQYSKGAKTDLALFGTLLFAINFSASILPFGLGLFMAMPITSLAFAHAYCQLQKGS